MDQTPTRITRFEETPEYQAFQQRKASLLSGASNPYFVVHDSALTDRSLMDGHWVLNFGSYNYAGMSGRKEVQEQHRLLCGRGAQAPSGYRACGQNRDSARADRS